MSAVDQHAEAHRLKREHAYGARRIAQELGISRHAATQLLARPLPQPPAAEVAGPVADRERPVAEPSGHMAGPVVGAAALVFRPVAAAPSAPPVPWLQVELGGRPWLLRELRRLAWWGLRLPSVVDLAVRSFAVAYHQAITTGRLQPGQAYEVQTLIRPLQHGAAT